MTSGESTDSTGESNSTESDDSTGPDDSVNTKDGRRNDRRVCRDTGREQGLVGKYDIWLCRQSFRELAREMGFRKYN